MNVDKSFISLDKSYLFNDYSKQRKLNKNGPLSSFFILLKATLGFGFLINQKYYFTTGYILGPIISFILIFLTVYCMFLICYISDKFEQNQNEFEIDNIEDTALKGFESPILQSIFYGLIKLFLFIFNYMYMVCMGINLSKFLADILIENQFFLMGNELLIAKFTVVVVLTCMLYFILIPEKLKYPSWVAMFVIIVLFIYVLIKNFLQGNKFADKAEGILFEGITSLIGNQLYSVESIGFVLPVRSTLKNKSDMKCILVIFGLFIFIIFSSVGLSFYLNFESPMNLYFDYYDNNVIIETLKILFYLTMTVGILIPIITNFLLLEKISFIKNALKTESGILSVNKILFFRLFLGFFMMLILFFGKFNKKLMNMF